MLRLLAKKPINLLINQVQSSLTHLRLFHNSMPKTLGKEEAKPIKNLSPFFINTRGLTTQSADSISERTALKPTENSESIRNTFKSYGFNNTPIPNNDRPGLTGAGAGGFKSMNFVRGILEEDEQNSRKKKRDVVHVLMVKKKTFVTVTDAQGNKKMGASAGSLEDRKGRSRLSRYAAEATAEHVGRAARKIGLKAVVMKVKGSTYFRKKRKVITSWRDGFRGEGTTGRSGIVSIYDVTQLPHNGCRLPKKRRV